MIDGKHFFEEPVKNNLRTYENIRTTATGQGDDYTTGYLLDYNYFNNYYKIIKNNADLKPIQQIKFTGNLNRGENINDTIMLFNIWETKQTISDFSQGNVKSL